MNLTNLNLDCQEAFDVYLNFTDSVPGLQLQAHYAHKFKKHTCIHLMLIISECLQSTCEMRLMRRGAGMSPDFEVLVTTYTSCAKRPEFRDRYRQALVQVDL
jgi:hypothetical protein